MQQKIFKGIVCLIAVYLFTVAYMVHYAYPGEYIQQVEYEVMRLEGPAPHYQFPIHGDEWMHLSQVQYVLREGAIAHHNPNLYGDGRRVNTQMGFYSFLAVVFTLTGLDPLTTYQFLPGINAALLGAVLALFLFKLTGSYYPGIAAAVFLSTTAVNTNIMGIWFFVPLTFSYPLILLCIHTYLTGRKDMLLCSFALYLALLFIYPLAAILLAGIFVLHILVTRTMTKGIIWLFTTSGIVAVFMYFSNPTAFLQHIVFRHGYTGIFEHIYALHEVYSIIGLGFALLGLFYILFKKNMWFLLYWVGLCSIPMLMFIYLHFSLGLPYQRALTYFLLVVTIISALGVYYTFLLLEKYISKELLVYLTIPLAAVLLIGMHKDVYTIHDQQFLIMHMVPYSMQPTFDFLATYPQQTVMTDLATAFTLYAATGHTVPATPLSNLGGGDYESVRAFFTQDCNTRERIMQQKNSTLIVSPVPIHCPRFILVHDMNRYIYEFR